MSAVLIILKSVRYAIIVQIVTLFWAIFITCENVLLVNRQFMIIYLDHEI